MTENPLWLQPALDYFASWLAYQVRVADIPGCAVAVAWRGKVVLDAAFGTADLSNGTLMTPRHRFRVASHSKAFTAAALMKLRDDGRVGLDDAIGRYVAGLHPDIASATIAQLLSNGTGAVRCGADSSYWSGRRPFPEAAEVLANFVEPAMIPPNSRLKYSNLGFALAGLVIAAIVGEPYDQWVAREIVAAAGLIETTPDWTTGDTGLAQGHGSPVLLGRRQVFPGATNTRAFGPAAGFVSTAADLCRFFHALSPKAETSFLSVAARREMTRGQRRDAFAAREQFYGLGTMSGTQNGWQWAGHGGGFEGYLTRTAIIPDQQLALSILTNAQDGKAHAWLDGAISILARFESGFRPTPALSDWSGRWWNIWGPIDLVAMGDRILIASPDANEPFDHVPELTPTGPDTANIVEASAYHHYGENVTLKRNDTGAVVAVHIAGDFWLPENVSAKEMIKRYI